MTRNRVRLVAAGALVLALAGCSDAPTPGAGTPSSPTTVTPTAEHSAATEETAAEPVPTATDDAGATDDMAVEATGPTLVPADDAYLATFDRQALTSNRYFILVHPEVDPAVPFDPAIEPVEWMLVDVPAGVAVEGYRLYEDATHSIHSGDAWGPIPINPSWPQHLILVDVATGEMAVDLEP